jgi:cobalt-zinc-cadmium efflux system outer membrane protein
MNWKLNAAVGMLLALSGCRAMHQPKNASTNQAIGGSVTEPRQQEKTTERIVRQVGFIQQDSPSDVTAIQDPSGYYAAPKSPTTTSNPEVTADSLNQIEQKALTTNPAIAEIQAELESLRGKLTQAGLPPNPTVGIGGQDINEGGGGGRYGVFFGREIVRGDKLQRSRSVVCAEIRATEQRLAVVQQRLLTDVRQRFYDLLLAQETVEMTQELVDISQNAVDVSKQLFDAKEAAQTSVLQSEVELQNALVVQRQAKNQRVGAKRRLAGMLGETELSLDPVEGNVREVFALSDFERLYDEVLDNSPEIAALFADVEQQRQQLNREIVEPIPNLTWQATLEYDTVGDNVVSGFQFGMPIPTRNRNQGAIHQARHQIVAAERRAEKKALDLRQRMASAYEGYLDAKVQVDAYESQILPKAKESLELVSKGYREGELDFLQLLTAQRTYSQINLTYLRQLKQVWRQNVAIRGMLLSGSLK